MDIPNFVALRININSLMECDADTPGKETAKLPISRQCELLKFQRTSLYRKHVEPDREREHMIKSRLDYWHTQMPYMGCRKLRDKLNEDEELKKANIHVGRKLIKRYMEEMGIKAVYPKPNLSKPSKQHKKYE